MTLCLHTVSLMLCKGFCEQMLCLQFICTFKATGYQRTTQLPDLATVLDLMTAKLASMQIGFMLQ